MRTWGEWLCVGLIASTCACGSDDGGRQNQPIDPQAGTTSAGGPGAGSGSSAGSGPSAGGAPFSGGSGGQVQGMAGTAGAADGVLPNGEGREYKGIVNLVDGAAAKALDDFILAADPFKGSSGELNLELAMRHFYRHYADEYDIVYFLNDHHLDTSVAGLHSWVSKEPLPGTGSDEPLCTGKGPAHLGSVVGIQVSSLQDFPPFAHEFAHHYAVHVDEKLGFGRDVDTEFPGHWGMTSANGQLGGFDATTLACETPIGAKPPNCTSTAAGRYHYTVDPFYPNANKTTDQPFGPIELYMMGLMPAAEVPSPLLRFEGAHFPFENLQLTSDGKFAIDATGLSEIKMSDIVARHGEVPALPADKRHFKAAVVLVTAAPADQALLDRVAEWAAIFGGEIASSNPEWVSFAKLTGGRATMSCRVGKRHEPTPDEVLDFTCPIYNQCNPKTQNCPTGLACYGTNDLFCAVPGTLDNGASCEHDNECKVGSVCVPIPADFSKRVCAPYCDHVDANASNACAKLCPTSFAPITDPDTLTDLAAFCFGGAGGACNPLLQDCAAGKACTGLDVAGCEIPGTTKQGQSCLSAGATCEKGTVCVGIQGKPDQFCQPYCDPAASAPAANACDTKCPKGAWEFTGYGVCIPAT